MKFGFGGKLVVDLKVCSDKNQGFCRSKRENLEKPFPLINLDPKPYFFHDGHADQNFGSTNKPLPQTPRSVEAVRPT